MRRMSAPEDLITSCGATVLPGRTGLFSLAATFRKALAAFIGLETVIRTAMRQVAHRVAPPSLPCGPSPRRHAACEPSDDRPSAHPANAESPPGRAWRLRWVGLSMASDSYRRRNLPFLDRAAALARLLRDTEAGTHRRGRSYRLCTRLPVGRRGHRVEEGRWHLSIQPVPRLDQGTQSRQQRRAAGAERDVEPMSLRQPAPRDDIPPQRVSRVPQNCRVRCHESRWRD
jgi:hypothetical protein